LLHVSIYLLGDDLLGSGLGNPTRVTHHMERHGPGLAYRLDRIWTDDAAQVQAVRIRSRRGQERLKRLAPSKGMEGYRIVSRQK
jgi:hypothetical protein